MRKSKEVTVTFKSDTKKRKKCFTPEHFAHPAKMHLGLLLWVVGKYTEPGDVILDPMAGAGTTMLACTLGRDVMLVDLEEKFAKMMEDNWDKVKTSVQPKCEMGNCQIIQGDARQLEDILVDKIITSPPYSGSSEAINKASKAQYQKPNTIIGKRKGTAGGFKASGIELPENPNNIGNLPYGEIDSIITSPPYEESINKGAENFEGLKAHLAGASRKELLARRKQREFGYSETDSNIGNLKSESYLEAMLQVYQQCYKVLRPQGLMILVTKNFIRNKKIVHLDLDTINLCEQAGFTLEDWHFRKITQQSFWRVIYHQKYPEVPKIEYEDILVFRK